MGCNILNLYLYFAYAISALILFIMTKGEKKIKDSITLTLQEILHEKCKIMRKSKL